MLKPKTKHLFEDYGDYHRNPVNQLTHKVGIPLVVFHILAMLDWIPLAGGLTAAHLAYVVLVGWYLSLDLTLGLVMGLLLAAGFPLVRITPPWLVIVIAVVGWVIQFAGHAVWEKRSPAFFTNLRQLFVGPLYFAAILTGKWRTGGSYAALGLFLCLASSTVMGATSADVDVLLGNRAAFDAKINFIKKAKQRIDLSYYIYSDDFTSSHFSSLLLEKAREGVDVSILVDAVMATPHRDFFRMLIASAPAGKLRVGYFSPIPAAVSQDLASWGFTRSEDRRAILSAITAGDPEALRGVLARNRPLRQILHFIGAGFLNPTELLAGPSLRPGAWLEATKRFHHKLLVVDGVSVVGGGRNIEDSYHWEKDHELRDPKVSKYVFMDVDFAVESPVIASQALNTLASYWRQERGIRIEPEAPETGKDYSLLLKEMQARARRFAETPYVPSPKDRPIHEGKLVALSAKVTYAENTMFAGEKSRYHRAWVRLTDRVRQGQEIILHNAYFYLPPDIQLAVQRALLRGAKVSIYTNSPKSSDLGFIAQIARLQYAELLRFGNGRLRIFEYLTPESLHAKATVLGEALMVGSVNADPRCQYLDSNNGLVIGPGSGQRPSAARQYSEWLNERRDALLSQALMREVTLQMLTEEREGAGGHSRTPMHEVVAALEHLHRLAFEMSSAEGARARHLLNSLFLQL